MADLHLLSPRGFRAGAVYAGIKSRAVPDVGLLICDTVASAAAVFTSNRVVSPAVKVGREHVASGKLRAVVVNSGNANACTGRQGERDAREMCARVAKIVGCPPHLVLPSSTGIIGHPLPMQKVTGGIAQAGACLGDSIEHALRFADAILTTDTRRKTAATEFKIGRRRVTLAGVTKGSGMIGPRLKPGGKSGPIHATMLAYLTTDAQISAAILRRLLSQAADASFNAVTVDDQASTNDTAALMASGQSGAKIVTAAAIKTFTRALDEICQSLAYQIAADGEGATKVVIVKVAGAKSGSDAMVMARTIANSPLVKCAMNGNDPNWGRIICAAGFSGPPFDAERAVLSLQGTTVFKNGQPVRFNAAQVSDSLKLPEVRVELDCRLGKGEATCWTCDLSKEYVTINADYHT